MVSVFIIGIFVVFVVRVCVCVGGWVFILCHFQFSRLILKTKRLDNPPSLLVAD